MVVVPATTAVAVVPLCVPCVGADGDIEERSTGALPRERPSSGVACHPGWHPDAKPVGFAIVCS